MADRDSYIVTTYKASKLHGERYRKREEVKILRDTKEREKEKKTWKREPNTNYKINSKLAS